MHNLPQPFDCIRYHYREDYSYATASLLHHLLFIVLKARIILKFLNGARIVVQSSGETMCKMNFVPGRNGKDQFLHMAPLDIMIFLLVCLLPSGKEVSLVHQDSVEDACS